MSVDCVSSPKKGSYFPSVMYVPCGRHSCRRPLCAVRQVIRCLVQDESLRCELDANVARKRDVVHHQQFTRLASRSVGIAERLVSWRTVPYSSRFNVAMFHVSTAMVEARLPQWVKHSTAPITRQHL